MCSEACCCRQGLGYHRVARLWGLAIGERDSLLDTIHDIHAAALDEGLWPAALKAITDLVGGLGASLEIVRKSNSEHSAMFAFGLPAVGAYIEHYAPLCKRLHYAANQKAGCLTYESKFIDEKDILTDPFYMEFLAPYDMRYFVGGTLANTADEHVLIGVQRSPKQGHVQLRDIELFKLLVPHAQQSLDVRRRLRAADHRAALATEALEWLDDGVVIIKRDGCALRTNAAAQAIFRRNDGIRLRSGVLEFRDAHATTAFSEGLALLSNPLLSVSLYVARDFVVTRPDGKPPYIVALRPLPDQKADGGDLLVFIHDPLSQNDTTQQLLRDAFNLTEAEAHLAMALRSGISPAAYALKRQVSSNTVYTHLQRIKQKCGRRRMAELVRLLNGFQVPLRDSKPST